MIVNSTNKKSNITFQATVTYNRSLILKSLSKDKKLTHNDYSAISHLLDRIDTFKQMKENSIVKIFPRADSGQVNLVGCVYDSSKKVHDTVKLRAVRNLVKSSDFRERYIESISMLIKNVEQTKKAIDKITQTVRKSKNIKGMVIKSRDKFLTYEGTKNCFEKFAFQSFFMKSLAGGYNPTARIVKLIKHIDKNAKGSNIYLDIFWEKKKKKMSCYFLVKTKNAKDAEDVNSSREKRILLSELFKKPIEDYFKS